MMTPELQERITYHTQKLAAALWEANHLETSSTLEEIEVHVREQILEHVSPQIGVFLSKKQQIQQRDERELSTVRLES
jgi:hypothetical protein